MPEVAVDEQRVPRMNVDGLPVLQAESGRMVQARVAVAFLIVGFGLTTTANSALAHAVGVTSLLLFVALAFPSALPPEARASETAERSD